MSLPRRTSPSTVQLPNQESGVYPSFTRSIDDLDDPFEDEFPDLPTLVPGPRDVATTKAALPPELAPPPPPDVPDLALDISPARPPMFRTTSSSNIAAVRPPEPPPPEPRAPAFELDSLLPAPVLKLDVAGPRSQPQPQAHAPVAETTGFDGFDDDDVDYALEISTNTAPKNHVAFETMAGPEPVSAREPSPFSEPTPVSTTKAKANNPRPGIIAFAGYGLPPKALGAKASYAMRVITRKWALRRELRLARQRRSRDVSLYEAALACADEDAVTTGIGVIAVSVIGGISAVIAAAAVLF